MIKSENTTVNAILSLLPGFLALFVIGRIVDIGNVKEFDLFFYGLILTLVCYVLAFPFVFVGAKIFLKNCRLGSKQPSFYERHGSVVDSCWDWDWDWDWDSK
jgi:hypothetical protein